MAVANAPSDTPLPDGISIRLAKAHDAVSIRELNAEIQALHQPFDPVGIRQDRLPLLDIAKIVKGLDSDTSIIQVACLADTVVGYARTGLYDIERNRFYEAMKLAVVHEIAVTRERRQSGIGTALMNAVCGAATARGATRIQLEYYAGNVAARQFYEHLGYRQLRHIVTYDNLSQVSKFPLDQDDNS